MKSKRVVFLGKIFRIVNIFLKRLSFFNAWIKRKYAHNKAKIGPKEIKERKKKKKERLESEGLPKIQTQEKKDVLEERDEEIEKIEETSKETQTIEIAKKIKGETSEKTKEEEKIENPIEEILDEREEELQQRKEKKEERTPKGTERKAYIKKTPTEEIKSTEKHPPEEKKISSERRKKAIDLGNASKRKYKRMIKYSQEYREITGEEKEEEPEKKEIHIRIESPFVEINLDELKISLVLPRQQFESDSLEEVPKKIKYKVGINGEESIEIPVKVKYINQNVARTQGKKVYLEKPMKSLEVKFPEEFQGRKYNYNHWKKYLYAFVAIGNNRGRMCYLYDSDGNYIPLPKKDVWILLNEDYELKTEEVKVQEYNWFWNTYRPFLVDLTKVDNLTIESRNTGSKEEIACSRTFSIEGGKLIEDDFLQGSPLFTGDNLRIKAPAVNPSGWYVWIQSKEAGDNIVKEDWEGSKELNLKLPDCLPCEYGEFQIDICPRKAGETEETLFFRWIDFMELKYPNNLIIPDPNRGGETENIEIRLDDIKNWDLKCKENLRTKTIDDNGCNIEVPPDKDLVHLSIVKKNNPENELRLQITIPRLKWRLSKQSSWRDRLLKIKRGSLDLEDHLIVRTNDFKNKYDMIAILEMNGEKIQEAIFLRKGVQYVTDLRRFYDTIDKSKEDLTIKVKIIKDSQLLGLIDVINIIKEIDLEKTKKRRKQKIRTIRKRTKASKSAWIQAVVKSKGKMRRGRGFSKKELMEAVIDVKDILYLNIYYDKRRKSSYQINVETLKKIKRGN